MVVDEVSSCECFGTSTVVPVALLGRLGCKGFARLRSWQLAAVNHYCTPRFGSRMLPSDKGTGEAGTLRLPSSRHVT
jgi:hypothetical protein